MVAIDTNIIVRLLVNDDADQYKKAYSLFDQHEVFIADTVILETEWVLRFAYDFKADQIADALTMLLGLPNVHVDHSSILVQVVSWHRQGFDFADAFHLAKSKQCKAFYTFDKKMINTAKSIDSCVVLNP
jgi:predicted nucleic-acid-binding protein